MKKIVLAGGCFWGVEEYFRRLNGTHETRVGYAQGFHENPSYHEVCSGFTKHAEVVEVTYDETIISLNQLIDHLFRIIDPTSLNKQGGDVGTQYRVGAYPESDEDLEIIRNETESRKKDYRKPLVFEVEKLKTFWTAETYHQEYLVKNPGGYCHVDFRKINPSELKEKYRKTP